MKDNRAMLRLSQIRKHLAPVLQTQCGQVSSVCMSTQLRRSLTSSAEKSKVARLYRPNHEANVLDTSMAYYDSGGEGVPLIFLHGNPTSSFLWRNVINVLQPAGFRCIAPDLVGFGKSGKPASAYRFHDHAKYLDEFLNKLEFDKAYLVIHDWGSALGFRWIRENSGRVKGVAHMESIVHPIESWDDFPDLGRNAFQNMRKSGAGEQMVIEKNFFVEKLLLLDKVTKDKDPLTEDERAAYTEPFTNKQDRAPVLQWPREIPIEGSPEDVKNEVQKSFEFMSSSQLPKLFIEAKPGFFSKYIKEKTKAWPNQTVAGPVVGLHFMQEDSGEEIGQTVLKWIRNLEAQA